MKLTGEAKTQEEAEKIILALGNTVGVAEVDTRGPEGAGAGARSEDVHRQEGRYALEDRRAALRKRAGRRYAEIVKANTPPVRNPDLIQPGWVLRIPPAA